MVLLLYRLFIEKRCVNRKLLLCLSKATRRASADNGRSLAVANSANQQEIAIKPLKKGGPFTAG